MAVLAKNHFQLTPVPLPPAADRGELDLFVDIPSEGEGEQQLHFEDFFDPPSEERGSVRGDSAEEEWGSEESEGVEVGEVEGEGVEVDGEEEGVEVDGEEEGKGQLSSHEKRQLQVSFGSGICFVGPSSFVMVTL